MGSGADVIPAFRMGLRPKSAPGDADDMKAVRELMREVIEDVRRVTQPCEQNERWSITAPIEHFDPNSRRDGDKRNLVPGRGRARVNRCHVVRGATKHNDCDQPDKRACRIEPLTPI